MKYILALLIFTSAVFADIQRSFIYNLYEGAGVKTHDGYNSAVNATWATVRATAVGTVVNAADTLVVGVGYTGTQYKIWRSTIFGDTIVNGTNVVDYLDSIIVTAGNSVRLDSIVIYLLAKNAVDSGACSGMIYGFVRDTCATAFTWYAGYTPVTLSHYNDYLAPSSTGPFDLFDSVRVDTTLFGMGDTATVTFAITNRSWLDEIECGMSLVGAITQGLRFDFVACYDNDNVACPTDDNPYSLKVSFNSLENAEKPPHAKIYWTEVEPVVASGSSTWQGSWRNASNSGWRNLWR